MSGSRQSHAKKKQIDDLAKSNPLIDEAQMRETGKMLDVLKGEGVKRRSYGISPPYERMPLRGYTRHEI